MTALATYLRTTWQTKQGDWCFPPLDPRITSTQSLNASDDENKRDLKRRLLVVYIHGFIGSERSFHSFPFDVHMQLRGKVARTHVVHSKVYPRYKTYKAFDLARDNLSQWLSAHEDPNTDIILVGHSMGGLLAQEVVLMRKKVPGHSSTRKHNILGTLHLDAPLLGAQNRVILAGILSPFRSKAGVFVMQHAGTSKESFNRPHRIGNLAPESDLDPCFNQPFANDVCIQNRGWWENILHFARKHEDEGSMLASLRHLKAHFVFGSCLLNSHHLKERYDSLRELDGIGPSIDVTPPSRFDERVRFVHFYTASYKGRTGKRLIERDYPETSCRADATNDGTRFFTAIRDEVDQHPKALLEDNDDPEELYFCRLARQKDGEIDPSWKKVMIATNDEINAHTVLFLPGPHYQDLIGRVSAEMVTWIPELDSSSASQKEC